MAKIRKNRGSSKSEYVSIGYSGYNIKGVWGKAIKMMISIRNSYKENFFFYWRGGTGC